MTEAIGTENNGNQHELLTELDLSIAQHSVEFPHLERGFQIVGEELRAQISAALAATPVLPWKQGEQFKKDMNGKMMHKAEVALRDEKKPEKKHVTPKGTNPWERNF